MLYFHKNIIISDSVTEIKSAAFLGCTSLIINVDNNNLSYCSIDGILFNKEKTKLIIYPTVNEEVYTIIPDSVTEIGEYAFFGCVNITSVTIPSSVTKIGSSAFSHCVSLASITIPDSVTEIGSHIFFYCRSLTSIIIPNSVTEIGEYAFSYCTSLVSITIPDSVTKIGDSAFADCTSLVTIYAKENGFDFVPINEYIDVDTKISVSAGTDAKLKVTEITDINEFEQVNLKLEDEKVESLYDISFVKDGTTVQPVGTATVKIPCTNENSKVYRAETDGLLTDMNAVYDNGYMVFSTNHFSLYALTSEKSDVLLGDVDGDGKISIDDVTDIQKHLANMVDFTKEQVLLADVDKNGTVSIDDVTLIQKHLAGLAVIE